MWRFAAAVTAVELALTALTALLLNLETEPDPYLSQDDLREFNLPFEGHETARRNRFDALLGFDSNFTLLQHPRQSVWISARVDQMETDFLARRRREENWATKPGFGMSLVIDDPGRNDLGYTVRHQSDSGVRCELVRYKGDRLLIVKVSTRETSREGPAEAAAACERRARLLQTRMLQKLRWGNVGVTAGPR